jgi:HSP20 family protein
MKNKTLIIILCIFCALLIFETGYIIGIGTRNKKYCKRYKPYWPVLQQPEDRDLPNQIDIIRQQSKRAFNDSFMRAIPVEKSVQEKRRSFFVTAMTSKETDQARIVNINIPGLDKNNISIEASGRYLTVQARQKQETSVDEKNYYAEELSATNYVQTISLPEDIAIQGIRAVYNNGMLTITMPKDKKVKRPIEGAIKIPVK